MLLHHRNHHPMAAAAEEAGCPADGIRRHRRSGAGLRCVDHGLCERVRFGNKFPKHRKGWKPYDPSRPYPIYIPSIPQRPQKPRKGAPKCEWCSYIAQVAYRGCMLEKSRLVHKRR